MPPSALVFRVLAASAASLALLTAMLAPAGAQAAEARVIVKYRSEGPRATARGVRDDAAVLQRLHARLDGLARRQGLDLRDRRALTEHTQVVVAHGIDSATLAKRLSADPDVESAEVDRWVRRSVVPSDSLYASGGANGPAVGQWYLKPPSDPTGAPASINAQTAWDTTTGSSNVVVGVIDTGVRFEHPDLAGKLLPGYDFVGSSGTANTAIANDGDLADSDASDPGDWVTDTEVNTVGGTFYHCTQPDSSGTYYGEDSSWHGTQVSGIIGALSNNGSGIAGVSWGARVLPLRALGKCFGYASDIVAAMRWGAGLAVPGLPANPHPAKVLNLSLGGSGACGSTYQSAVDAVIGAGAAVVVAAGNGTGHAVGAPANCSGVITVAGLRHIGTKVAYSDLGPEVAISAPGGNCVNGPSGPCLFPLPTTTNTGSTAPASSTYSDGYSPSLGTSFSAPQVSGVAALMWSVYPGATPAQIKTMLQSSARAFPTEPGVPQCTAPTSTDQGECNCTTSTCGAGMLDATAAVASAKAQALAATGAQALIAVSPASPVVGQVITLDASGSLFSGGGTLATTSWTLVSGGGVATGFDGATNAAQATLTSVASGTLQVQVQVTDNLGHSSTQTLAIYVANPPPPAAPPAPSGGGGGGALGFGYLAALLAAVLAARRVRQPARAISRPPRR